MTTLDDALRAAIREELHALFEEKLKPLLEARSTGGTEAPTEVPLYVSTVEAARRLGVTVATVQAWVRTNQLRGHKAGRLLRIRAEDLHTFMNRATPAEVIDLDAAARRIMLRGGRRRAPSL